MGEKCNGDVQHVEPHTRPSTSTLVDYETSAQPIQREHAVAVASTHTSAVESTGKTGSTTQQGIPSVRPKVPVEVAGTLTLEHRRALARLRLEELKVRREDLQLERELLEME
jgi:hypothetical protein